MARGRNEASFSQKVNFLITEALLGIQTGSKFQAYDLGYYFIQFIYMRQQQILAGE